MEAVGITHPLRRLFTGLVEQAFCCEVGMCEPALTDYVSELLVSFIHVDRLQILRNSTDRPPEQVAAMLAVACEDTSAKPADRDRLMYRHIGDFTLFWAGVYPEQLKLTRRNQSDVLLNYVSQGKRSYAIVSELATDQDRPPARVFRVLSEDFEYCLHGLSRVRRSWEEVARTKPDSGQIVY